MEQLRKIGIACWDVKEKVVLVLMVLLLGYRVFILLKNQPEADGFTINIEEPTTYFKGDPPGPPERPVIDSPPPITPLVRNDIFLYVRKSTRNDGPGNLDSDDANVKVLMITDDGDGGYKARITTGVARKFVSEGDSFESYTLMKIDKDNDCVEIYSESTSSTFERCIE